MGKTVKNREYSYNHCVQRARERYGIELTPNIYDSWLIQCKYSNRIQVDPSNHQSVYVIEWEHKPITVVVKDSKRYGIYISTVLPSGTKLMFGKDVRPLTKP